MTVTPDKIARVTARFRQTRAEIDLLPNSEAKSKALAALERAAVSSLPAFARGCRNDDRQMRAPIRAAGN